MRNKNINIEIQKQIKVISKRNESSQQKWNKIHTNPKYSFFFQKSETSQESKKSFKISKFSKIPKILKYQKIKKSNVSKMSIH